MTGYHHTSLEMPSISPTPRSRPRRPFFVWLLIALFIIAALALLVGLLFGVSLILDGLHKT